MSEHPELGGRLHLVEGKRVERLERGARLGDQRAQRLQLVVRPDETSGAGDLTERVEIVRSGGRGHGMRG